jgi:RES domain-containing protein
MLVYRITLSKYAGQLVASGNEARWNSSGNQVIYTAGSRSLACLENLVHRSGIGANFSFTAMIIEIPDRLPLTEITEKQLPKNWNKLLTATATRNLGDAWYAGNKTPVLKIPSAIIPAESNYLLNTGHPLFPQIKLLCTEPFLFDARLPF